MAGLEETYRIFFELLKILYAKRDMGLLQLAAALKTRPETVRRHLTSMKSHGLIDYKAEPGKKMEIVLTEKGKCIVSCLLES